LEAETIFPQAVDTPSIRANLLVGDDVTLGSGTGRPKTKRMMFMRIMALVLASALAVCFMNPASAATKRSDTGSSATNPDKSAYPATRGCTTYCYRSGRQKIQNQKANH
jgi:hypothetical protein